MTIRKRFRFKRRDEAPVIHLRINENIRALTVLVIDGNTSLGEIPTSEALAIAKERELDLVEVSPKANPPVCRIMDYGKYLYQQSKQQQVAKAKQKKVETKGVRIGLKTDTHDLAFKKQQAEKFLKQGDKVKIDIVLRGREKAHQDLARTNLQNFLTSIQVPFKIEDPIKRFPGGFNVLIAPVTGESQQ